VLEAESDAFSSVPAVVHHSLERWKEPSAEVWEWDKAAVSAAAAALVDGSDSEDKPMGVGTVTREGGATCLEETERGLVGWAR
jgi:hypothetical protein